MLPMTLNRSGPLVEAKSAKRVQLGFDPRGVEPTGRIQAMTGTRTHAVDLTDTGDDVGDTDVPEPAVDT